MSGGEQPLTDGGAAEPRSLWTYEFAALWLAALFCFCNMAIFYGFYNHLAGLGISPGARGPLLALEPLTALVCRPFLSAMLHLRNSMRAMRLGIVLVVAALASYPFVSAVPAIAAVRVLHGLGYVIWISALMTAFTRVLPGGRVAQGFGLLSLASLLPAALMPPFVEVVARFLPSPGWTYAMAAPLMLAALLFLRPLGPRLRRLADALPGDAIERPTWREVLGGLLAPGVAPLLAAYLLLLLGHTMVYFFMKTWALSLGAANPGLFFAVANLATIALRVGVAGKLDTLNPGRWVGAGMLALGLLVPCFGIAGSHALLLGLAAFYGVLLGANMPLVNTAMFRVSAPRLRPANVNLLLVAMDAGFILGPLAGGWLLAADFGLRGVFVAAGAAIFAGGLLALPTGRLTPAHSPD